MDGLTVDKLLMMAQTGELEQLLSTTASQSPGYKCETCKDTGWLHFEDEQGYRSGKECDCRLADKARRRIARSGLQHVIEEWTFDAFETVTPTQKAMKDIAMRYADALLDGGKQWLFMGGQVGSGKSHLCTAVCGQALHNNRQVRYMQWVDDGRRLKAMVNDDAYEDLVEPWLNADILYIDDLFKMQHRPGDRARPTDADIRAAFSIINGRYVQDKPTIITSEWLLSSDLLAADGGTFSRVYQKCRDYLCEISPGSEKNYRLRGGRGVSNKDVKSGRGKWIRTKIPAGELFEKKFRKTNLGCWEWQAAKNKFGYGAFRFGGKTVKAHRFSWEFYIGDIPNGLCVLHRCDNPGCVNPDHLFLGTRTDNAKDRDEKGRCASKEKHYCAKLSEEQVKTIRNMWTNGIKGAEIAKLYGVDPSNISLIVNNKTWKGAAT